MKKIILFLAILTSFNTFSQSITGIVTRAVNVRWEPSSKSRVIKTFSKGKKVIILETKGGWSFIKDPKNEKKGWISSRFLELNVKIIKQNANVRKSPGGTILKQIPKGQLVAVLLEKGKWKFIKDLSNDKKGWVHQSLLSNSTSQAISNSKSTSKSKTSRSTASQSVASSNPPNCDYIITAPSNGEENVLINPTVIKWKHASGSPKGYYFSIATSVNNEYNYFKTKQNKLLKKINIGNVNSYSISDLEPNTEYFLSLVPYNDVGLSDCEGKFSFKTGQVSSSINSLSSEQTIINRLSNMGVKWKWDVFDRGRNINKIRIRNNNEFLAEVKSYKGVPYLSSGTSRSGVDCSGLIYKGLINSGYNGNRLNAQSLAQSGKLIADKTSLIPGDLVCFTNTTRKNVLVQHIGIYVGNNKFLHASSSKGVINSDINDPYYWKDKFIFGVRLNGDN